MSIRKFHHRLTAPLLCVGAISIVLNTQAIAQMELDEALTITAHPLPSDTPSQVIIRNATIWTMESDGILEETDILLRDGKIAAIDKNLNAGSNALEIDGTGKHVTPGIIDAHSHSAAENTGVNEGVPSISSEVRIEDIIVPDDPSVYYQLAGGVTAIHVMHGSANAIGGQNAMIKLRWGSQTPDQMMFEGAPPTIKFALGENPKRSGFVGGPGREARYPATRMGVAAIIRDSFKKASDYQDEWQRYQSLSAAEKERTAPPRRDLRLEAIVEILDEKRTIHAHSYRADEILMLMRLGEEVGFKVGTFQHVLEGYQVADEMAAHGAYGSTFSDWWSYKIEAFEAIPYNAAIMEERGVLVSLNSDNDDLARRLNLDAAKIIRYGGIDPVNAMAMVTTNPAKQLGIDERVGSLVAGKDADIAVWSGDPLSAFSHATHTFVDGKLMFDRENDLAHRARVKEARDVLIAEIADDLDEDEEDEKDEETEQDEPPQQSLNVTYQYAPSSLTNDKPIAIVGATIHPLDQPVIENGVVVFRQGKITAVGDATTAIPDTAEKVDATGKHLWPGVIHTNTVLGIKEIDSVAGTVDVAETGEINADVDVSLAIDSTSTHIPVARSGGITHAVVVPEGGVVAGTTALIRTDGWTWEEMAAVRRHSMVLRWPSPIPARFAALLGRENETLADRKKESDEQIETLNELLDAAQAYRKSLESTTKPDFDPQLDALLPIVKGESPIWVQAREKHAMIAATEWAKERNLRIVITDARDAYLIPDYLAENNVSVVLQNIVGTPPRDDDAYDTLYAMPAVLEDAGVLFTIASGTRTGGSGNARYAPLFAGIAAAYGLDKEAAYRSVTLNAAKMLGLDSVLGSITVGKSASLVLTDGDLLEPASSIEKIWIDGLRPDMDDVQKQADRKWRARP